MKDLIEKLIREGGCIVCSDDCGTMEIASARARGDFFVDGNGFGFVRRLPDWLKKHSRFARGADKETCEIRMEELKEKAWKYDQLSK